MATINQTTLLAAIAATLPCSTPARPSPPYGLHSLSVPSAANVASRFRCGWWATPIGSLSCAVCGAGEAEAEGKRDFKRARRTPSADAGNAAASVRQRRAAPRAAAKELGRRYNPPLSAAARLSDRRKHPAGRGTG